jgi:hypothetical protein
VGLATDCVIEAIIKHPNEVNDVCLMCCLEEMVCKYGDRYSLPPNNNIVKQILKYVFCNGTVTHNTMI